MKVIDRIRHYFHRRTWKRTCQQRIQEYCVPYVNSLIAGYSPYNQLRILNKQILLEYYKFHKTRIMRCWDCLDLMHQKVAQLERVLQ